MAKIHILIVDDQLGICTVLSNILTYAGYSARYAQTIIDAQRMLALELFHVVILDVRLETGDEGDLSGIWLMREISKNYPLVKIIMLANSTRFDFSSNGAIPAFAFVQKSASMDSILIEFLEKAFLSVNEGN